MQTTRSFKYLTLTVAAIALLAISTIAEARSFSRGGSYTTGRGTTGTVNSTGSAARGQGWNKSQSITTNAGKTYGRTIDGGYNKDTQSVDRTVTGNNGKSYATSSTYDKDTKTYSTTATGANGGTVTKTGTAGDGAVGGTVSTGNGKSATYNTDVTRGEDGVSTSTTVTGSGGKTYTGSSNYSYDQETKTLTDTYTGNNGKTHTGSITYDGYNQ